MALRVAALVLVLLSGCFPTFIGAHCDSDADCVPAEACVDNHCSTRPATGGGSAGGSAAGGGAGGAASAGGNAGGTSMAGGMAVGGGSTAGGSGGGVAGGTAGGDTAGGSATGGSAAGGSAAGGSAAGGSAAGGSAAGGSAAGGSAAGGSAAGGFAAGGSAAGGSAAGGSAGGAVDTTPPSLITSVPTNGAMGVGLMTRVVLTFSEAMNQSSLTVAASPTLNLGMASWDAGGRTVSYLMPASAWLSDTGYSLTIDGADLANNLLPTTTVTFRTLLVDTTPPTVFRTVPLPDAGDVDVMTNPSITFSEPVQTSGATFTTTPDAGCMPTLDPTNTRLSCNNPLPLAPLTDYQLVVPTTVRDVAGNALAQPFTLRFRTAIVPDTTRPTIVSVTPADMATGARPAEPMVVTFSEPMDPAATQSAFAVSQPAGVTVTYSWSTDGRTMTATPAAAFTYGQVVRWQINTNAADLAGNRLPSLQSFAYTVRRSFTVSLTPIAYGGTDTSSPTGLFVGDNFANQAQMGFLAYQLPTALEILSGTFTATQTPANGAPFSDGTMSLNIVVEGIPYTSPLDSSEVNASPFCVSSPAQCVTNCNFSIPFSTNTTTTTNTIPASSAAFTRLLNAGLAQTGSTFAIRLRRRYPSPTCSIFGSDNDNVGDYVRIFGPTDTPPNNPPTLSITYTAP
ncbi:MAG: Ig-like domain-containing protein [Archangium sp.]|nr:Ig-like domain-containing protein [Archangium sp.]